MQKIIIKNLIKSFGERELFKIEDLEINDNEVIGIVGNNGSGKTTFFNILSGIEDYDCGIVDIIGKITYIKQFDELSNNKKLSGGEKTRNILNMKLRNAGNILLVDEPTNNLDISSIEKLIIKLKQYNGILCIISHNRNLLDRLCTNIVEFDEGKVTKYVGNYTKYIEQKRHNQKREQLEYMQYIEKKNKLEKSIAVSKNSTKGLKKHPSRMGNSEARLNKRQINEVTEKLEGHTKVLEKRLDKLEVKEKPKFNQVPKMSMKYSDEIISKVAISGNNINVSFGDNILFKNAKFKVYKNSKTAIIGDNGVGKTTLINYILDSKEGIKINGKVKIGYFAQSLDNLDYNKSIFENVMKDSVQNETIVRNILARLLFNQKDIEKNINILSGGEKVKVIIAKILVSDSNVLILDEPTNFLDTNSLLALENLLKEYEGTILFTTHDKMLVDNVATDLLVIQNKEIVEYRGNYSDYINSCKEEKDKMKNNVYDLELEFKITAILSKLSITKNEEDKMKLEEEYNKLIAIKKKEY